MVEMTSDIKGLVDQSIKQGKENSLTEVRIDIPAGYGNKFYEQREAVKQYLADEAYDYKEVGLRDDLYNGWRLNHVREGFGRVPDDMIVTGKLRHYSKRGAVTANNYRIWVEL